MRTKEAEENEQCIDMANMIKRNNHLKKRIQELEATQKTAQLFTSSLNFIENLTATSLSLPQSEFDLFMSGKIPPA